MAYLIKQIEFLTGCSALVNKLPSRPFDVPVNELDIGLAKSELSWMPKLQLDEGLKRSIQILI
jgi:nucleoside-diphosphate-sugar epimerase